MKPSRLHFLCFSVFLSAIIPQAEAQTRTGSKPFRIAGYLPDYRFGGFEAAQAEGLTDLIVFSAELQEDGAIDSKRIDRCPWSKLQRWKNSSGGRLWLTIGGWERSEHFASVARASEKRKRFIDSISDYARTNRLDGIDLDWEHPKNAEEERAYGQLMHDLKAAFEPLGLQLSVTVAGWQKLDRAGIEAADAVQVMAYDHPGRHSTFEASRGDLNNLIDAGVPASKVVLGVPFYGRDVKTRTAMTWREIVSKYAPRPDVDEVDSMYFNGQATIRRKVDYAVESGLGGVMIWEIGQDAPGESSLTKTIRDQARSKSRQ